MSVIKVIALAGFTIIWLGGCLSSSKNKQDKKSPTQIGDKDPIPPPPPPPP